MENEPEIISLFGPRTRLMTGHPMPAPATARTNLRSFSRILVFCAGLLLLLAGYLGLGEYWLHTRWIRTEAEVLNSEIYERVDSSAKRGLTTFYGFRCLIAFRVAGEGRRSQLDFGPIFASKMDAQIWAAHFRRGGKIPISYEPPNAARVRFAGDSLYVTAAGTLKLAGFLFGAGWIVMLASKSELSTSVTLATDR